MPRREITHFGSSALQNILKAIMNKIGHWECMIKDYKEELTDLGEQVEGKDPKTTSTRQEVTSELEKTWVSKTSVSKFHRNTDFWNAESQYILLPFPSVLVTASLPKIGLSLSSITPSSTGTARGT
jgi:hypothetical protein